MNAGLVDSLHKLDYVQCSILPPSLIENLATDQSFLAHLRGLEVLAYGGAPLSKVAGELVRPYVPIYSLMGGTEMYCLPTEIVDQREWNYFRFSEQTGAHFVHYDANSWKLSIKRRPSFQRYQSIFYTFPNCDDYDTKDLYSPHPTIPDLWHYIGRADDIITLSNGEKLNPLPMESLLTTHSQVKGALVVGEARFQTALLVEPESTNMDREEISSMRKSLWPLIDQVNIDCPAHGRISKDLILFTSPSKPFRRSGKGTVQRRITAEDYERELNILYDFVSARTAASPDVLNRHGAEDVSKWLQILLCRVGQWESLEQHQDFFAFGMDSLQAIAVIQEIKTILASLCSPSVVNMVTTRLIYENSTLNRLESAVHQFLPGSSRSTDKSADVCVKAEPLRELETLDKSHTTTGATSQSLHEYDRSSHTPRRLFSELTYDIPVVNRIAKVMASKQPAVVLLTGSTGSLGPFILKSLLKNPMIGKVICLDRSASVSRNSIKTHTSDGAPHPQDAERVTFLQTTLSKPYFGLDIQTYSELLQEITHVLHNAWSVDFNLSFSSFEPQLRGVRQLIDFSCRSKYGASIFFISSVSAAMNAKTDPVGAIPEVELSDWSSPARMGYAQSKHFAERLLSQASKVAGIQTRICRVGQIAGPVRSNKGKWNNREWFPSMIASSRHLRKIPESLGSNERLNWIPVDRLSKILVDMLIKNNKMKSASTDAKDPDNYSSSDVDPTQAQFYHAVNPHTASWSELLPTVLNYFKNYNMEVVSLQKWYESLKASANDATPELIEANPAIKLLPFFRSMATGDSVMPKFATDRALSESRTLADIPPVQPAWMEKWLRQWDVEDV